MMKLMRLKCYCTHWISRDLEPKYAGHLQPPSISYIKHNPSSPEQLQTQVHLSQTSSSDPQPVLQVFHMQRNDLRYRVRTGIRDLGLSAI